MKNSALSSSILFVCAFLLAGCDSLGLPDWTKQDEVPADVKAQPRLVNVPPPVPDDQVVWPRLGDVPFMPKDFTPKPVYDHYMNELEYDRAVDADAKQRVDDEPAPPLLDTPAGTHAPTFLTPPQLPKEP